MNTLFIKFDKDGFLSEAPLLDKTDGYTAIQVGDITEEYIVRYWSKYRYVDGNLMAPGNLPDLNTDTLITLIQRQSEQIATQGEQLAAYKDTLDKTTQAAAKLGSTQAQLQVTIDKANEAMAKIGGQVAKLQVTAQTTTDTTETEAK